MNANLEPLAFATVEVKGFKQGSISKENGHYELELEPGKFDLIVSMLGYKTQMVSVIIRKDSLEQNIILEAADATTLSTVTIKGKLKDRAEEYIRNVIRNKEAIEAAAGNYSCNVYIKALQEDSVGMKKAKKSKPADSLKQVLESNELNRMAMAEVVLQLDRGEGKKIKEERTGVSKRGNEQSLFYLSTMEGDFNIYQNIINARTISPTPFVSPVSYSGLLAYRFKMIKTETVNGRKQYTISIKPRQLSNATVEGEITIADSSWVVLHTRLQFPKYHLAEYDFFEVEQQYEFVDQKAWMISRQSFTYNAVADKRKSSGKTVVSYRNFELNKNFPKNYFGVELSAASQKAYEQDSNFWKSNRTEPLTAKELRFIHFKDSVYQATHSKDYLDSVDRVINKFRWQNIAFRGQTLNNHEKRRQMRFPSLPELFQPFQLGGLRIMPNYMYTKTWESRKNLTLFANLSYGIRNKDLNGNIRLNRMYNPFNRGFYEINLQKDFA
ncbi:MAG: carboxypeptidase-like regulatory domain-containing protein, partial [Chitinophagaceae bacterium]|nr:carboxypeptidase-like regulatory domain-containing protein [Chitinophagaceae bacterium]